MLQDFKQFILRGNVVDLAIGVVVGAAFGTIVNAFVRDMLTPLIAAVGGQPNFSGLAFTIHGSKFMYGDFINAVISFLIIATVIFFFVVEPVNKLRNKLESSRKSENPDTKKCPECLSEIPMKASRCKYCTAQLVTSNVGGGA